MIPQQRTQRRKVCTHCDREYTGSIAQHSRSVECFIEQVKILWGRIKDPGSEEEPPLNLEIDMSKYNPKE